MRSYSLLILVLGAVASEPFFPSGREYEFDYKGRIMSGIPELDETHFAGMTIDGRVVLQAVDGQNFKLALRDVKFNKFNERLERTEEKQLRNQQESRESSKFGHSYINWRNLRTPESSSVSSEFKTILETPVQFSMINGEIRQVQVSGDEPEWSLNFKKALVSLMKIRTPSNKEDLSENIIRGRGQNSFPDFWKTMEEGVDGKCENTYQVTELPEYMLQEVTPLLNLDTERCEGKKVFQIIKSRNVNKCVKRAVFQTSQPGKFLCPTGNCDSMFQRSSITRYLGCGTSRENMELQAIVNEGELQQDLMAYNAESFVTGTRQTLQTIEVRTSLSNLPQIRSPRTVDDVLYEYPNIVNLRRPNSQRDTANFKEQQEKLQKEPVVSLRFKKTLQDTIISQISPDTLKQKIIERLTEVAKDLKEVEEFEKKNIAANTLSISKVYSLLSVEQMKSLYNEVKGLRIDEEDREIVRQLVLEISVMCGTNPAVLFIKEMIESEEFSTLRVGVALSTLPHYIQTPTVELLDELFELIKSPVVTRNMVVKSNAQLAFATLLNKACIDSNRFSRFPIFVFGEFCSSETSELTTKYIPYLANQLESHDEKDRASAIIALGTIGHESVISILLPYIEGSNDRITPFEQRMAIYSLGSVSKQHRETILPIFSTLIHNPSEDREIRIAALSMMMNLRPSMAYFQKLATSTWFEKDTEFQKFVYSTLKSLSEIDRSELPSFETGLFRTSENAKTVLHLAKPVPGYITSTLNYFTSDWMKKLQVGYQYHGYMSTTKAMQQVYGKLEYFLEQLKFTPVEFAFNMHGYSELVDTINNIFGWDESADNVHSELRDAVSSINLKYVEDSPFSAGVWTRLFDDVNFMYGIGSSDLESIVRNMKDGLTKSNSLKQKLCGSTSVNFVKVNNLAPTEILIPSDMGLPIIIESHMPAVFTIKGEVNLDCSVSNPSVSLKLSHKTSVAYQGYVGTICPFTKEVIVAGVEQHWSVNYPVEVSTTVEMGKLKVVYSQTEDVKPSTQEIDFWAYTVKPFASIKPLVFLDFIPLISHPNTKIIESESDLKSESWSFGEYLGMDMKVELNTETDIRDMKTLIDHFSLYKYNPVNVILFSFTQTAMTMDGKPSLRQHEVKMVYNPSRSTTKEAEIDISLMLAYKNKNDKKSTIIDLSGSESSKYEQQKGDEQQEIQRIFQKIEEGFGLVSKVDIVLKGGSPKSYSYTFSAGKGSSGMEHHWTLHVEGSKGLDICVDGDMVTPSISLRSDDNIRSEDITYSYKNVIGFGQTCAEHKIEVTGTSSVSHEQRERARHSDESKKCKEASRRVEEIKKDIEREESRSRSLDEPKSELKTLLYKLSEEVEKKEDQCSQAIKSQATLDEVKFTIEYTEMPEEIKTFARYLDIVAKGALLPFMSEYEDKTVRNEVDVEFKFNTEHDTVDVVISTEKDTVRYENVRLPEKLRELIPFVATENALEQVLSVIQGEPLFPVCRIGDSVVNTHDNRTYAYELDECLHVLAIDCSEELTHAVLGKKVDDKLEIEVFTHCSKISIKPSPSSKDYEIDVDGKSVQLKKDEKSKVNSRDGKHTYVFERYSDDVIVVHTPYNRIKFDAEKIELENTEWIKSEKHCGLCGTKNGDKRADLQTAQSCVIESSQETALSYRIKKSCSSPHKLEQMLSKGKSQKCEIPEIEKIPISRLLKGKLEKCSEMRHSMVRQGDRLCISQTPIVECGGGCGPKSIVNKSVPFTCIQGRSDRVRKLYEQRVRRGEIIPELRNIETTFSTDMALPSSCSHPGL